MYVNVDIVYLDNTSWSEIVLWEDKSEILNILNKYTRALDLGAKIILSVDSQDREE